MPQFQKRDLFIALAKRAVPVKLHWKEFYETELEANRLFR